MPLPFRLPLTVMLLYFSVAACAPTRNEGDIKNPVPDAVVSTVETATGDVYLKRGYSAWIVVVPHAKPGETYVSAYHPQPALTESAGGFWSVTVRLGAEGDVDSGRGFEVDLVAANATANKNFYDYLTNAERRQQWPGMPNLPYGAEVLKTVEVTRR